MSAPVIGYTVAAGTREKLTRYQCPRNPEHALTLWRTGYTYSVEETRGDCLIAIYSRDRHDMLLTTEGRARDHFEALAVRHTGECL